MDEKNSKKVVYSVIKKLNEFYDEIFESIDKEKPELKLEDVYVSKKLDEFTKLWYEADDLISSSVIKGSYSRNDVDSKYKGKVMVNPLFAEKVDVAYEELKTHGAIKKIVDQLKEDISYLASVYFADLPYEKKKSIAKEIFNEKDPVEVVRRLAKLAEKGLDKIEKEGIEKFIYSWDKTEENVEHARSVSKNLLVMIKKYYGIMFGFLGIVLLPFLLSSKIFTSNFSLVNGTTFLLFNVSILFMLAGVVKIMFQDK